MITFLGFCLFAGGLYSFIVDPSYAGVGMMIIGLVVALAGVSCKKA